MLERILDCRRRVRLMRCSSASSHLLFTFYVLLVFIGSAVASDSVIKSAGEVMQFSTSALQAATFAFTVPTTGSISFSWNLLHATAPNTALVVELWDAPHRINSSKPDHIFSISAEQTLVTLFAYSAPVASGTYFSRVSLAAQGSSHDFARGSLLVSAWSRGLMPPGANITAFANASSSEPLSASNQLPVNQTDVMLKWDPAIGPANKYSVVASARACNDDIRFVDPSYWKNLIGNYPSTSKVLYEEVVVGTPDNVFSRLVEGFNFSRIYCVSIIASDLSSNSSVAFYPMTLYAPRWHPFGPTDATAWAAIGVIIAFAIVTLVGITVYLFLKKRSESQFEYAF